MSIIKLYEEFTRFPDELLKRPRPIEFRIPKISDMIFLRYSNITFIIDSDEKDKWMVQYYNKEDKWVKEKIDKKWLIGQLKNKKAKFIELREPKSGDIILLKSNNITLMIGEDIEDKWIVFYYNKQNKWIKEKIDKKWLENQIKNNKAVYEN